MLKTKVKEVLDILEECYPDARPELLYENEFELLVAVILSAQCTDKRVNIVTSELFKKYRTANDFSKLTSEELIPMIRSCGLAPSKAKGIVESSKIIVNDFGGKVPSTIEELQKLPSVGRKTANVVASVAYGVPAIAVDTHVFRVSNRIGLAKADNVTKTEKDLMKAIPKERWTKSHHLLIFHGRRVCKAQNPLCEDCKIRCYCNKYMKKDK